jgi:hypothetical protein
MLSTHTLAVAFFLQRFAIQLNELNPLHFHEIENLPKPLPIYKKVPKKFYAKANLLPIE